MSENAATDKFLRQWVYLCEDKLERIKKTSTQTSNQTLLAKVDVEKVAESPQLVKEEPSQVAEKFPIKVENSPKDVDSSSSKQENIENKKPLVASEQSTKNLVSENSSRPEPEKPKISHDWYQTEAFVVVEVRLKGLKTNDVTVDISAAELGVNVRLDSSREYALELHLAHPVVPEQV